MQSAITISMVSEARGGPFVFWDELEASMVAAAKLGFDAVEIFPPSPEDFLSWNVSKLAASHGLKIAAVGTGAGWVKHRLQLADENAEVRQRAIEFIRHMIDAAATVGAPTIIGSMQGRSSAAVPPYTARGYLRDALGKLGEHAAQHGQRLLYEPLNRYETDQANTLEQGMQLIEGLENVALLADWFHMNIEEADMAAATRAAGQHIGHVHFADTNRQAVGLGHLDAKPIVQALQSIGYRGYLSAEVFSKPDPISAAKQTIHSFENLTGVLL